MHTYPHTDTEMFMYIHIHIHTFVYTSGCIIYTHFIHRHFVVQLFSHVRFFVTPWTAACHASLSITNCWSLLKLMSTELVMPSNHLVLCFPLLFLPSIFPSIRVFSNKLALLNRWSKYWNFSCFSICKHAAAAAAAKSL